MRDLCESAKKGKVCCDDLCHGMDVTLCGFDKEAYDEMVSEERYGSEHGDQADEDDHI